MRSNLLLGHDEPDDFYNTLEYFGLDSVIASLPNGINTSVDNHNFNLSAGEKAEDSNCSDNNKRRLCSNF